MHKINLRKVGGSIMMSVPPAILEQLKLQAGSTVTISLDGEKLMSNRVRGLVTRSKSC